jgi:RNA polymerase sigma factor (sigma-70 family)
MLNLLPHSSTFAPTPQPTQAARFRNLHAPFLKAILFSFSVNISPCFYIDNLLSSPICSIHGTPVFQLPKPLRCAKKLFCFQPLIFLFLNRLIYRGIRSNRNTTPRARQGMAIPENIEELARALHALRMEHTDPKDPLTPRENTLSGQLYTRLRSDLKRYIYSKFRNLELTQIQLDEAASEVWLIFLQNPNAWKPEVCCFNKWFFYQNAYKVARRFLECKANNPKIHRSFNGKTKPNPAIIEDFETKLDVEIALSQLPNPDREILQRKYFNDEKKKDIGKSMGVSPPRISQLHHRALEKLRQLLSPYDSNNH